MGLSRALLPILLLAPTLASALNTFDARIDLGPRAFLLAGFPALAIAIGTIGNHAIKVAHSNPNNALSYG